MKKVAIAGLLFLAACSKLDNTEILAPVISENNSGTFQKKPEICTFGIREFNLSKRPFIQEPITAARGGGGGNTSTTVSAVILLDFDGHLVSNTIWNYAGPITCSPANLTTTAINEIIQRISIDFSPFNIIITTNETLYNNAPFNKRMRVIITESWEWYGQAGGVAFVNSFTWGDNTPCFVFSSLLNYNKKNIAEAASHEAGHTLGLYHQSRYDANCVKLSEYHSGTGNGELSWAPIMGTGYYSNLTTWHNGPNPNGCNSLQNDLTIITSVIGTKDDDYGNTIRSAGSLTSQITGIINTNTDIDMFKVSFTSTKTVRLLPVSAGESNTGGNLDLVLKVYSSKGLLLYTINDVSSLGASIDLSAGTYYVTANTIENANSSTYGMLGAYNISLI